MLSLTFTSKRFVITGLLILFSLGLFLVMPANDKVDDIFQGIVMGIAIFLVIPVLYCKIVLKESLKNMGWQKGKMLSGVLASIICISLALGIVFFLSRLTEFPQEYFFPVAVQTNFLWFMLYELLLVSFTALLYELFFRGFIQLLWLKDFGLLSVVLQTVLFGRSFYLISQEERETRKWRKGWFSCFFLW